jgi:hypothetical protein
MVETSSTTATIEVQSSDSTGGYVLLSMSKVMYNEDAFFPDKATKKRMQAEKARQDFIAKKSQQARRRR